jgi:drug/metabolite transporter, DME family
MRGAARAGVLLIVGAALLWSLGGVGIKSVPEPPLKIAFFRSLAAAVTLFAIFRPRRVRITPAFALAVFSYAICLITFVTATKWTTAANAIFLQYSGAIWVLLLSPIVLKEKLHGREAAAIVAALGGMALFFVGDFDTRGMAGNLVAIVSSLFFASLVLTLRLERGVAAEAAVTWGNVAAAAMLLPFVWSDLSIAPRSLAIVSFLGVFQIGAAYALFVRGLRYVTATQASLIGMLEPVANPVWVLLLVGERPHAAAVAGALIVLAAIGWSTVTSPPQEPAIIAPD